MLKPTAPPDKVSPHDMVDSGLCTGCGTCVAALGKGRGRIEWNARGQLQAAGSPAWMDQRADVFSRICPFSPAARNEQQIAGERFADAPYEDPAIGRYRECYVGYAAQDGYRQRGSSGGMVSWMAAELLRRGLVDGVAHVAPTRGGRLFQYTLSHRVEQLNAGAKSRYYPVEMSQVLGEIARRPGRYAVVGVPCFIKAVQLLRDNDPLFAERIVFTLGLVCGHMKSRHMAESFAWQMGAAPEEMERIEFRMKDPSRPANWYRAEVETRNGERRQRDWWHLAGGDWGAGFFQNPACDFCDDVVAETADVSFGDAWVEPYASDGRGTNVIVVRSPVGSRLLSDAIVAGRIVLQPVDAEFVRRTQAAGFRQRREGLAYRLALRGGKRIRPVKRVAPGGAGLSLRRKLVYRCRSAISRQSDRVFTAARRCGSLLLFRRWAAAVTAVYDGLTYSRGSLRHLFAVLGPGRTEGP